MNILFSFFLIIISGCGIYQIKKEYILPQIRVLLTEDSKININLKKPFKIIVPSGKLIAYGENEKVILSTKGNGIEILSRNIKSKAIKIIIDEFEINQITYRGEIIAIENVDKIMIINEVNIEKYLYGVVPCEMPVSAPIEALKAQAVASRSFAYFHKLNSNKEYDVDATVAFQVYGGKSAEETKSTCAVDETTDEVIVYKNNIANSVFHANCGGSTESAENVWGYSVPYLIGIKCEFCKNSHSYNWEYKIEKTKLEKMLNVNGIKEINVERSQSGRVKQINIKTDKKNITLSGEKFRSSLGINIIKSTKFNIENNNDVFIFKGNGWGHGVGMCQDGAIEMARKGYNYKQIIKKYFQNVEINKIRTVL
jgi:stage II sporulation protein D